MLIVHKNDYSSFTIPEVQSLVAGGVSGLKPESVTVKVAAQGIRPLPVRVHAERRGRNLLAAFAGGVAVVLLTMLAVLVLQNQRQRQQLAQLRSESLANHTIVSSITEGALPPTAPPSSSSSSAPTAESALNEITQGATAIR